MNQDTFFYPIGVRIRVYFYCMMLQHSTRNGCREIGELVKLGYSMYVNKAGNGISVPVFLCILMVQLSGWPMAA